ncbi:MAG TPA: sigma-70 family RNA polymerase sigma factor [Herpetosiphonaceae bacterium]|nr:sigma-70 family RNA polymerase sigma factor [Herpetosiphonaceae bacterium]
MLPKNEDVGVLTRLLAQHEPAALEHLYQYARLLEVILEQRFGSRISDEDRKDIVADALIHAWQTGDRFDPTLSSLKSWLIMVLVYRAREFLRRNGAGNNIPIEQVDPGVLMSDFRPLVVEQRPGVLIRQLLQQLPPRRARIVEMYYYEGRPVLEIAKMLGITPATVKSHLSKGRDSLRQLLEEARATG